MPEFVFGLLLAFNICASAKPAHNVTQFIANRKCQAHEPAASIGIKPANEPYTCEPEHPAGKRMWRVVSG